MPSSGSRWSIIRSIRPVRNLLYQLLGEGIHFLDDDDTYHLEKLLNPMIRLNLCIDVAQICPALHDLGFDNQQ